MLSADSMMACTCITPTRRYTILAKIFFPNIVEKSDACTKELSMQLNSDQAERFNTSLKRIIQFANEKELKAIEMQRYVNLSF